MLDIKFIRENKDLIKEAARKKRIDFNIDELISADDKRRELTTSVEQKRMEQNAASDKIASAKDPQERQSLIDAMQQVKKDLQAGEESLKEVMKDWQALMVRGPNIPDISVPEGDSDADNKEVKV